MSNEIRDRAREKIARDIAFICGDDYDAYPDEDKESCLWWADKILSIEELAVVDREAELTEVPLKYYPQRQIWFDAQAELRDKAGWVKEEKDE